MTKRLIYCIFMLCLAALVAQAQQAASITDRAAQAAHDEMYNDALKLYREAEHTQGASSALYYNMANTYYHLKDNPRAILYYERALKLDPANDDARFNLNLVRTKAQIHDESNKNYLLTQIDNLVGRASSNTWATVALMAFVLMLICAGIYLFMDDVAARKVGFFGGIALLVISALSLWSAIAMYDRTAHGHQAIVMETEVLLSDSPRPVKQAAKAVGKLQAGQKVNIVDSIDAQGQRWFAIEMPGKMQAWLNAMQVEKI